MGNYTEQHDTNVRTTIEIIEGELDLLSQLHLLRDTIARNPDWVDENDGADERVVTQLAWDGWYDGCEENVGFNLPCALVFAISHVSHHWRQLAINAPSLWTNIIITPKIKRHTDIFQAVLHRAKSMPIAIDFRSPRPPETLSSTGDVLMESIQVIPLIHAQQIHTLSFLTLGPVLSFLHSQTPFPMTFSRLTVLSVFGLYNSEGSPTLAFSHLRQLLSAAPQLKTLKLQHGVSIDTAERADEIVITLPMLENLTIIESNLFVCKLLDSLSAPEVCQLKLLMWDPEQDFAMSCLFVNDNNNIDSGLPRFPNVQNLTLSSTCHYDYLNTNLINAFPRVTHLTLCSPTMFYEIEEAASLAIPTFQWLRHLTLDFSFEDAEVPDTHGRFTWLPKLRDRADRPLLLSVFDRSTESMQDAKKHLFWYYEELQQYGTLDKSSSRLDEFLRWQAKANGEPEVEIQS
ncbi:hypothetical protein BJ138DRAFT_1163586 [Hygrophoropsis aurantiaca]|uniref:Uncharacterized protein n=1 Tax=Hygrophoropsis aurantiaca TaxID=72124 RepID=A0ACB7ZYU4_9AGAM|nr:hypothetical protein BJ138DRAFT_1163586 [Hygrophoropsis aurantiaca]